MPVVFATVVAALGLLTLPAHAQIFVANSSNNTVGEYNASNGAAINASFITGLGSPRFIAIESVPEPAAGAALAALGALGLALRRRMQPLT